MTPSGQAAIDKVAALAGWTTNAELVADVTPLIAQAEQEAVAAFARDLAEKVRALPMSRHVMGYPAGKRWVRLSEVLALLESDVR